MYEIYKKLRDERGLSDYQVAVGTGIVKSTFTDWRTGKSQPKLEKLIKIAKFLGVSVDCFVKPLEESIELKAAESDGKA